MYFRSGIRHRFMLLREHMIGTIIRLCGWSCMLFVFLIFCFVFREAMPLLTNSEFSFREFFTSIAWRPTSEARETYGVFAMIVGTLSVTGLSMCFAVPFGLGAAIFLSEFCHGKWKEILKISIEFLAAIPSVVWGFIGYMILGPLVMQWTGASIGVNLLTSSILLALMSVPVIVSVGEDALRAVPDSFREAATALGANRWEMVYKVLFPAAKSGLLAAVLLGVGRAIGETMAVLMATGHSTRIPHSLVDPVRTLTATIASEMGEVSRGSTHYQVLFLIGILLFTITFLINLIADLVVRGIRKEADI